MSTSLLGFGLACATEHKRDVPLVFTDAPKVIPPCAIVPRSLLFWAVAMIKGQSICPRRHEERTAGPHFYDGN